MTVIRGRGVEKARLVTISRDSREARVNAPLIKLSKALRLLGVEGWIRRVAAAAFYRSWARGGREVALGLGSSLKIYERIPEISSSPRDTRGFIMHRY